jgi:hypothetical protein
MHTEACILFSQRAALSSQHVLRGWVQASQVVLAQAKTEARNASKELQVERSLSGEGWRMSPCEVRIHLLITGHEPRAVLGSCAACDLLFRICRLAWSVVYEACSLQDNVVWKEQWIATRLQKAERDNNTVYLQVQYRRTAVQPHACIPSGHACGHACTAVRAPPPGAGTTAGAPLQASQMARLPAGAILSAPWQCLLPFPVAAAHPCRRGLASYRGCFTGEALTTHRPEAHSRRAGKHVHKCGARQQVRRRQLLCHSIAQRSTAQHSTAQHSTRHSMCRTAAVH